MSTASGKTGTRSAIPKLLLGTALLAVTVLLLVALAGGFNPKIDAARRNSSIKPANVNLDDTVEVQSREIPRVETAVGTVRAVHETAIASKILAKVVEVAVIAGQKVTTGEILMKLDDEDLRARLKQARASADAARSARDQAKIEYDRVEQLIARDAAASIEWDRVQTALRTADAELARANQSVAEAETVLSYATITSPLDGVVVDKRVEAGDTATPGQVLLKLYDPTRMQLVASVRESLTHRLSVGQTIGVNVDTLDYTCDGLVSEIVPEAESTSRSFSVKVTGPCPPGVYAGMFGRIIIPLDPESVLLIPGSAIARIGQLDLVQVVSDGRLQRRAIKVGRMIDDQVEVLSGLRANERVVRVYHSTDATNGR